MADRWDRYAPQRMLAADSPTDKLHDLKRVRVHGVLHIIDGLEVLHEGLLSS